MYIQTIKLIAVILSRCPTSPLPLSTAIMRAVLPVTSSISTKLVTPPGSCLASTSASSSRTMSAVLSVQACHRDRVLYL